MIIRWCQENGFNWAEFPTDWEKHGRSACHAHKNQMAHVATHLIAFWDGVSHETKHMLDLANKQGLASTVILVDPD